MKEFLKYGLISEVAEADPSDKVGPDVASAKLELKNALERLNKRAKELWGEGNYIIEDNYDWFPKWAGGPMRGLNNAPPKVYRQHIFAKPIL